jgi:signal transduction histidine kinase
MIGVLANAIAHEINNLLIDIGDLVAKVTTALERSAATQRVHLVCKREPSVGVCGFADQLTQVLTNLIRNAAQASPPDAEVVISVRSIHRHGRKGERVTIHDCGPGIPENIGLGLWVSRTMVLRHDGTIRFRSSECAGTTFEVFLPAVDPTA